MLHTKATRRTLIEYDTRNSPAKFHQIPRGGNGSLKFDDERTTDTMVVSIATHGELKGVSERIEKLTNSIIKIIKYSNAFQ